MSFSGTVKEELAENTASARHCQLAEFAAIIEFCGVIGKTKEGKDVIGISSENPSVVKKCFTLLKKTFNIVSSVDLENEESVWNIIQGLKLMDKGTFRGLNVPASPMLLKNSCCKRAFLRGAYLCVGSMSDPNKGYHLELVCETEEQAVQIVGLLADFDIEAKTIIRKKYHIVYLKESSAIVDFLNVIEAHVAMMEFENLRILKDVRNTVNRRVNCETANISKTVNAAAKQIEEIEKIRDTYGFKNLPPNLREMAEVRLEHPDATLSELGEYLSPKVGKSGVNHRLRRLSEIAERI